MVCWKAERGERLSGGAGVQKRRKCNSGRNPLDPCLACSKPSRKVIIISLLPPLGLSVHICMLHLFFFIYSLMCIHLPGLVESTDGPKSYSQPKQTAGLSWPAPGVLGKGPVTIPTRGALSRRLLRGSRCSASPTLVARGQWSPAQFASSGMGDWGTPGPLVSPARGGHCAPCDPGAALLTPLILSLEQLGSWNQKAEL